MPRISVKFGPVPRCRLDTRKEVHLQNKAYLRHVFTSNIRAAAIKTSLWDDSPAPFNVVLEKH
jgi:hypothetical protein